MPIKNKKVPPSSLHFWLLWVLVGLCAGLFAIVFVLKPVQPNSVHTEERQHSIKAPNHWSFSQQIDHVMPSVVSIHTVQRQIAWEANQSRRMVRPVAREKQGLGSGVIFNADGYVITNAHVIEGADQIRVTLFDGREVIAQLMGQDRESDLAVLKVPLKRLQPLSPADKKHVRVGDIVFSVGNPYGLGHSVSMGIVSGLGRNYLGLAQYENYIQTDAAINRGNSGGPLVNSAGQLIGINTITLNTIQAQGISFAIPIDTVNRVFDDIMKLGYVSRGWVGVESQTLTPELARLYGLPLIQGMVITRIFPGSPSHTAGMQPGDILTHINGERVYDSARAAQVVSKTKPGDTIELTFVRDHMSQTASFALTERPLGE